MMEEVVADHRQGLSQVQVAQVQGLVNATRPDERGVQLLGVVGGHDLRVRE